MNVVIIGSGNVATVMGKKMKEAGVKIVQVCSRNQEAGSKLAGILQASFTTDLRQVSKDGDLYILAVSDTFIQSVASKLHLKNKVIVHTAGSVSRKALLSAGSASCSYGVLYPMQSLNKERNEIPPIPVLIDGSDAATTESLSAFASVWSERIALGDDEQRLRMHIASVFVSNFTTYMYVLADEFLTAEGLDFKMLLPLINESSARLQAHKPAEVQTGPAMRKDIPTINLHIDVLSQYPKLQAMYKMISAGILDQ